MYRTVTKGEPIIAGSLHDIPLEDLMAMACCKASLQWVAIGLLSCLPLVVIAEQPTSDEAVASYPNRTIRFVIPSTPGSGIDELVRIMSVPISQDFHQSLVADNRPGAGGVIGLDIVAKARPDGYTLALAAGGLTVNPSLYAKLPFDTMKDFRPVAMVACAPLVLLAQASLGISTVKELVALAKATPGGLNYGSPGIGTTSHLAGLLLTNAIGVTLVPIPYKGSGEMASAIASGQVQISFLNPNAAAPLAMANRVRMLAVTSSKRMRSLPAVPTLAESGFPGFEVNNCYGVLAPAATPAPIADKLSREFQRVLKLDSVKSRLEAQGYDVATGTSEELADFMSTDMAKWSRLLKDAGVKPE